MQITDGLKSMMMMDVPPERSWNHVADVSAIGLAPLTVP